MLKFLDDYEYLATWILLPIEIVFLYFLLKEFKMTRKSFELQEEELKNKYCHEIWHLVGDLFFYNLFDRFHPDCEINKYMNMMKSYLEKNYKNVEYKLDKEIEKMINNYLEQKNENFKGDNTTDNFKEVFEKYKEIVLQIATALSTDLYKRITELHQDIETAKRQADEIMRMLEEKRFLNQIGVYTYRAIWGDETISSLRKLLENINVPKGNKKL